MLIIGIVYSSDYSSDKKAETSSVTEPGTSQIDAAGVNAEDAKIMRQDVWDANTAVAAAAVIYSLPSNGVMLAVSGINYHYCNRIYYKPQYHVRAHVL